MLRFMLLFFFFSSRRRHTRFDCDWSSDVCSSDLVRNDGIVKVLDFGLARRLPAGGAWGSAAGGKIRSEERRVGEEGRSRGSPYHLKKKKKEHGEVRSYYRQQIYLDVYSVVHVTHS